MAETDSALPLFYAKTLGSLLPIFDDTLSLSDPSAQAILSTALDQLYLISRIIISLAVFSDNETVEELGDNELVFMTVGWVIAECEGRGGLGGPLKRKQALERSDAAMNTFLSLLASYSVLTSEEQAESSAAASGSMTVSRDPAKRREAKIRQYRREKELREQISLTLARDHPSSTSSPVTFILSLLPSLSLRPADISISTGSTSVNPGDAHGTRDTSLILLRLLHTLGLSSLSSITMELEILGSAPIEPIEPAADDLNKKQEEQDDTWRLDRIPGQLKPRELISGGGRVLQPFTILPSTTNMSDRERLRGEVFRTSHRLPTMTIDEYLAEEEKRGNVITGGGQASYDAPTESEVLALAAEDDGTVAGQEKVEQKRLKEEHWAQFAEANPRGAGNTMNRG